MKMSKAKKSAKKQIDVSHEADNNGIEGESVLKVSNTSPEKGVKASGRKKASGDSDGFRESLQSIKNMEQEIKSSKQHLNNIPSLIDMCETEIQKDTADSRIITTSMLALCRIFSRLMADNSKFLEGAKESTKAVKTERDNKDVFISWMHSSYKRFTKLLVALMCSADEKLQIVCMRALMGLTAREVEVRAVQPFTSFSDGLFKSLLFAMVSSPNSSDQLFQAFLDQYVQTYTDVKFFTYRALSAFTAAHLLQKTQQQAGAKEDSSADKLSHDELVARVHLILSSCPLPTAGEDGSVDASPLAKPRIMKCLAKRASREVENAAAGDAGTEGAGGGGSAKRRSKGRVALVEMNFGDIATYRKAFTDCWLLFLRVRIEPGLLKDILVKLQRGHPAQLRAAKFFTTVKLHTDILPSFAHPLLLSDFLTDCYSQGGLIALLGLDGLFHLIQEHNLEYPDFYTRLYALLTPDVLLVRYKGRFMRLLELFLQSPLLPAYLVAAFVKRLARLTLTGPAPAVRPVLVLIYNLARRHPAALRLLHCVTSPPPLSAIPAAAGEASDNAGAAPIGSMLAAAADGAAAAAAARLLSESDGKMPSAAPPLKTAANSAGKASAAAVGGHSLHAPAAAAGSGGGDAGSGGQSAAAQRPPAEEAAAMAGGELGDLFDAVVDDPARARAMESSLWELTVLARHFAPDVARATRIFETPISRKTTPLSLNDALQVTYQSLSEGARRKKAVPPRAYEPPESLLSPLLASVFSA